MAAIKIYGSFFSTATMRVTHCLTEKGLDYDLLPIDLTSGQQNQPHFLSLNPFGQVPAFQVGDLTLFESRAITRYISEVYAGQGTPLLPLQDSKAMATVSVWMEVEGQMYNPPAMKLAFGLVIKGRLGLETNERVVEEQEGALGKVLDVYERRLAQSKYLGGDHFSLADLHHLPTMNYLMGTRIKAVFDMRPNVRAWCDDILARPAWKKVFAAVKDN